MRSLIFVPLLICISCNSKTYARQQTVLPNLTVQSDSQKVSLKISKLDIHISITGNIASTVYDITFYNPFDRVIEGSFELPLAEDQSVFRYGLDINGTMREGVVVEKQQARVAYENTVRKTIDPGLIEKIKGNSYRTRIYPIPANGYKRVLIGVEQSMRYNGNELLYHLPVHSSTQIESLHIQAITYNSAAPSKKGDTPAEFAFTKKNNNWMAVYEHKDFTPSIEIKFAIPFKSEAGIMSFTGEHKGDTYFYLALPTEQEYIEKKLPASITLLWDVSASATTRNVERELTFLKDYLDMLDNTAVTLIPFRHVTAEAEIFNIHNGNSNALIERIRKFEYDGGTQLGSIDLSNDKSEQVLLFSDGVSTFGKQEIILGKSPVAAISSSVTAEYGYLKYIATQSHGSFINLNILSNSNALHDLRYTPLQFLGAVYNDNEIAEVYSRIGSNTNGYSIAGILKANVADIKLQFGYGNNIMRSMQYQLSKDAEQVSSIPRSWAVLKLEKLEMQPGKNKTAITEVGKEFSVVTSNTSLLVLDRIEDYIQYKVIPPAELKHQYDSIILKRREVDVADKNQPIEDAVKVMEDLKEWYETNYSKKVQLKQHVAVSNAPARESAARSADIRYESNYTTVTTDSTIAADASTTARRLYMTAATASIEEVVVTGYGLQGRVSGLQVQSGSAAAQNIVVRGTTSVNGGASPMIIVDGAVFNGTLADIPQDKIRSVNTMNDATARSLYGNRAANGVIIITTINSPDMATNKSAEDPVAEIAVKEWKANADYLKAFEKITPANYYSTYLKLKENYRALPIFYVDVAGFFYRQGSKALALQVLSNIAELKLEDPELLRVMGHQLQEWNESMLALETLRYVKDLRGEHPQSYRDLAHANAEMGNYQEAADGLYHILINDWDERFDEMTAVVLNEFNAIIGMHNDKVNTRSYDKRLIYAMPVDVRIVITWSSDDCDIDLWVTDPLKEKCFYSYDLTKGGGKLSGDITEGFGPEDYCMKKAVSGEYIVEINYFGENRQTIAGPVTVKAELYTHYGTPQQKKRVINVRLDSTKEVIKIGVLKF
jgi:TonB-dependent SusC/RagA subfamily outer membrane receptor